MTPAWTTDTVTTDLSRAVRYTLLWGFEGVALRLLGGPGVRVPHVAEGALLRRLADAELSVVSADPGLFEGSPAERAVWLNDLAAFEETAAFCRRIGCGVVRVGALGDADGPPDAPARADALRQLADAAARHGLRLAVRNEAVTAVATGADLARLLAAVDHPAAGADWRLDEARAAGEAAPEAAAAALLATPGGVAVVGLEEPEAAQPALDALAAAAWSGPVVVDAVGKPAGPRGLAVGGALVGALRRARRAARGKA